MRSRIAKNFEGLPGLREEDLVRFVSRRTMDLGCSYAIIGKANNENYRFNFLENGRMTGNSYTVGTNHIGSEYYVRRIATRRQLENWSRRSGRSNESVAWRAVERDLEIK